MRVFVAGATGVVGRRAVVRLVAAGHQVTGVARSTEKGAQLCAAGATPVAVDLFDREALCAAVAGHDAVVNLATKIPPVRQMARADAWSENNRIRTEASRNLVDAALDAGARVYVQESLAFLYGEHGAQWCDAASTPWADTPVAESMGAAEANSARFTAAGGRAVVLRFGRFYAPESEQTRVAVRSARHGFAFDVGRADGYTPMIDADDAAAAVVAALDAPPGVYDIVDDPLTRREQHDALASAVGRRRLWQAPMWKVPASATMLAASQRVSNARFREATSWRPASPSVREGYRKTADALGIEPALGGWTRLVLWLLALTSLQLGLQATFAPASFYADFPGGRGWVALDGAYNQHLVRDFGALNLALCVVTLGAIYLSTRAVARLAALAWLVWSVPHLVYHLRHLAPYDAGDAAGTVVSLALAVLGAIAVMVLTAHRRVGERLVHSGA